MVNNLGGTSVMELHIVARDAIQWLGKRLISHNFHLFDSVQ